MNVSLPYANHDRSRGCSVMVWAYISMQSKTDLYIVQNGKLTAARYVNEILDVYVRPYAGAIGPDFIFMDDNVGSSTSTCRQHLYRDGLVSKVPRP